jgi:branched-chain amino acid transport system substrate-binding protein
MSNRRRWLLAALMAVLLAAAGCSSSSGGSSQATASGSAAASAAIKVGILCSCSGALGSNDVPKEDVYRAWADTVNAAGGINGHPVQLIAEDDGSNPGTSFSDAKTLISDHVAAILDITNFDTTWASAVAEANIPVVGSNVFDAPFYENPDFYPEGQTNDSSSYAVVSAAKEAGATNFAYFYCAEAVACSSGIPLFEKSGQALGVPLTYQASVAETAPNYTAQCLAAEQKHVTALALAGVSSEVQRVGQSCSQQSYNPIYLTEGAGFSTLLTTTPGIKDNLWSEYSNLPFWDSSSPAVKTMNAAVDKYYPGLRSDTNTWSELAALSWPSGLLLEDAVKAGGLGRGDTPAAAEVVKGLESLKGDTLDGWAPALTFAAGKPHPVDCWFTAHMQNGVPQLTDGGRTTCESGAAS